MKTITYHNEHDIEYAISYPDDINENRIFNHESRYHSLCRIFNLIKQELKIMINKKAINMMFWKTSGIIERIDENSQEAKNIISAALNEDMEKACHLFISTLFKL